METSEPASSTDAPNWNTQKDEIHCPMCEYNLCGLTESRCPECGYRFVWSEILDARARPHPYLFEHHPESNFKSFWKTARGTLRPRKFWSELHAAQKSRPARLLLYCLIVGLLSFGPILGTAIPAGFVLAGELRQAREKHLLITNQAFTTSAQAQNYLDQLYPLPPQINFFNGLWELRPDLAVNITLIGIVLTWPWLTFGLLMVFRFSMRRAKVKSIHVLRAIIYCFDFSLWLGIVLAAALPTWIWTAGKSGIFAGNLRLGNGFGLYFSRSRFFARVPHDQFTLWAHALAMLPIGIGVYRLCIAYRKYLRFDWPLATVLATQVILLLVFVIVALNWDSPLASYWRSSFITIWVKSI